MQRVVVVELKNPWWLKETERCCFGWHARRVSAELQEENQFLQMIFQTVYARQYIPSKIGLYQVNPRVEPGVFCGCAAVGVFLIHCSEENCIHTVGNGTW